jgi:hypothetical protein
VTIGDAWTLQTIALAAGVVIGSAAVSVLAVLMLEAQRRRDRRAAAFQSRLADPITRELGFPGVAVLPTVTIPLWSASTRPALIRLEGQVPSYVVRDRVLRLVEREARRLRYYRIEDRIRITPVEQGSRERLA